MLRTWDDESAVPKGTPFPWPNAHPGGARKAKGRLRQQSYAARHVLYIESALTFTEKSLIAALRRSAGSGRRIALGIGDDTALVRIPAGHEALVTTDFSLEGVHFRHDWHPPESVGHRCLARGLSDIAAMGGTPIACFLSLALPNSTPDRWVKAFTDGLLALARRTGVILAGGDTAQSPGGILADIVVLGSAPKGQVVRRSGARPGDLLYVSGTLGQSAAVLKELLAHPRTRLKAAAHAAHFFPQPRLAQGHFLAKKRLASAMIDISDGLSTDLHHICEESNVGAVVEAQAIPRGNAPLACALHGGDDYELLFAAPPDRRIPSFMGGVPITRIGRIVAGRNVFILEGKRKVVLEPRGWQHFDRNRTVG
jgi:thiamine-monophosphate kinase